MGPDAGAACEPSRAGGGAAQRPYAPAAGTGHPLQRLEMPNGELCGGHERGGGGCGGSGSVGSVGGTGGQGGGGRGAADVSGGTGAVAGTVNTGGAGGAGGSNSTPTGGKAGGSGIVILKFPSYYTATFSGGVTQSTSTDGSFKISIITAAGISDKVSWALWHITHI